MFCALTFQIDISPFKLIYNQIENFRNRTKFLSNYNKFIINTLNKINKQKKKLISTYYFSTLYTVLPHKVYELYQLIDFVFQGNKKTFIKVSAKGTVFWGKKVKVVMCLVENHEKLFKENIIRYSRDAYFFQCGWSVVNNVGWKYDRIVVGWVGECCGEPS